MNELQEFITYHALREKQFPQQDSLIENLMDSGQIESKNICFKVTPEFAKNLSDTVGFMGCTKREFIINALTHALSEFQEIYTETGVFKMLNPKADDKQIDAFDQESTDNG